MKKYRFKIGDVVKIYHPEFLSLLQNKDMNGIGLVVGLFDRPGFELGYRVLFKTKIENIWEVLVIEKIV